MRGDPNRSPVQSQHGKLLVCLQLLRLRGRSQQELGLDPSINKLSLCWTIVQGRAGVPEGEGGGRQGGGTEGRVDVSCSWLRVCVTAESDWGRPVGRHKK